MKIERTLVLIKPDGISRGLIGRIISRFEDAGMKIVAMELQQVDESQALQHYTEDISVRRGEKVRELLVDFLKAGTILAAVIEGVNVIENVRKMVGSTEPKSAAPGTIRGDFAHVSFSYADSNEKVVENLIHASSDEKDAEREIWLWFNQNEICEYKTVHETHTF